MIILLLLSVFVISRMIYRLFWHPLAKFPGPKLAAATNLYGAYYDLIHCGSLCRQVARLHVTYGMISYSINHTRPLIGIQALS